MRTGKSDMRKIKIDYELLMQDLDRLTGKLNGTLWTFWRPYAKAWEDSGFDSMHLSDLFPYMLSLLGNPYYIDDAPIRSKDAGFPCFEKKYRLTSELSQLGEEWKLILLRSRESYSNVHAMIYWLEYYRKFLTDGMETVILSSTETMFHSDFSSLDVTREEFCQRIHNSLMNYRKVILKLAQNLRAIEEYMRIIRI